MELLKLLESLDYILILGKLLGLLAELLFRLEVLLEIEVAKLAVDLDQVVELLYIKLISIVDIAEGSSGNRPDLSPTVLDFTELREEILHVFLGLYKSLEVLDNSLLLD